MTAPDTVALLERLTMIGAELQGLPHVTESVREAAALIQSQASRMEEDDAYRIATEIALASKDARIAELEAGLKPFAVYYEVNDLDDRLADDAIEVPVGDLRVAHQLQPPTPEQQ